MWRSSRNPTIVVFGMLGVLGGLASTNAQTPPLMLDETLGPPSTYTRDYCLAPCACPSHSVTGPTTGHFTLRLNHSNPLFDYYDVTAVAWVANPSGGGGPLSITGSGTYQIGGEAAIQQQMVLDLTIAGEAPLHYDSGTVIGGAGFPNISITLQTAVAGCQQTVFQIESVPSCRTDFNGDGQQSVQDIFDFLNAWFLGDPRCDFNGINGVTVQDIFDFLAAWFAGC